MKLHHPNARRATCSRWSWHGGLLAMLTLTVAAWAHDPFEITTKGQLGKDALTLTVTMARSTALAVAAGGKESPTFDPEKFSEYRARFLACAPSLFAITAGGRALNPTATEVGLGIENDVEFRLVYPRPPAGALRLDAAHLPLLGSGHGNVITLDGVAPAVVANQLLTPTDHVIELTLAGAVIAPHSQSSSEFLLPTLAIVLAVGGTGWLWRRKAPS